MLTYTKYPYLADFPGYLSKVYGYQVTVRDLLDDAGVLESARRRVREAVESGEAPPPQGSAEEEVSSFYLAASIVAAADSIRLTEAFAQAEARRARRLLEAEDRESLLSMAKAMGLRVSTSSLRVPWVVRRDKILYKTLQFSVNVADYLRVVSGVQEARWRLVNSMVKGGQVYLDEKGFRDFLSLAISRKVKQLVASMPREESLRALAVDALRLLEAKEARIPIAPGLNLDLFPPCMKELASSPVAKGDRGLYAYLSFLATIGTPSETIASELARALRAPQDKARALTEALLREGLGSRYRPYTCEFMKREGLCPADCGAKTPIEAYRRLVRSSRGSQGATGVETASQASPIRS